MEETLEGALSSIFGGRDAVQSGASGPPAAAPAGSVQTLAEAAAQTFNQALERQRGGDRAGWGKQGCEGALC